MFTLWTWYAPDADSHKDSDEAQANYAGSQWRKPMVMARFSDMTVDPYDLGHETGKRLAGAAPGDRVLFLRHLFEQRDDVPDAHLGDLSLQAMFGWYHADAWYATVMIPFFQGLRGAVDSIDAIECEHEKQRGPYTYPSLDAWADDVVPLLANRQINMAMPAVLRNATKAQLTSSPSAIAAYGQWCIKHRAQAIQRCVVQLASRFFGAAIPVGNYYDYEPDHPTAMGIGRPELYLDPAAHSNQGFRAMVAARNRSIAAGIKSTGWWCQREPRATQVLADPRSASLELLGHLVASGVPSLNYWARLETEEDRQAIDAWCDENVARLTPPQRFRGISMGSLDATTLVTGGMESRASDEVWTAAVGV